MTKNEIDEQIAKLQAQKAEIEKKEREQAEAERKKREEEKGKELADIKNAIKAFNEKYTEYYSLASNIWTKFDNSYHYQLDPKSPTPTYRGKPIDEIISEYLDSLLR